MTSHLALTPEQRDLLHTVLTHEYKKKCEVRFRDDSADSSAIRRCIYLDGGIDMVTYLLNFDQEVDSSAEQAVQESMDQIDPDDTPSQTSSF